MPRRRFLTRSARACLTQVLLITAAAVVEGIRDPINWIGIAIFFASVICIRLLDVRGEAGGEEVTRQFSGQTPHRVQQAGTVERRGRAGGGQLP